MDEKGNTFFEFALKKNEEKFQNTFDIEEIKKFVDIVTREELIDYLYTMWTLIENPNALNDSDIYCINKKTETWEVLYKTE